jgi:DNA polymerase-3 subunit gamma/tau
LRERITLTSMSYLVLARKWRPKSFETLVGQEHVVRALTHALENGRLHHAYLFTGTRGIGKTTIARILAKSLNCESGVSARPCGTCSACVEIDGGRFVDLLEVDAATNTKVDEMRQLLENAVYAPTRGRYKVYVIDEVHMLSNQAFNAMLKTLEEPPEHVKFILATTDPQKIPVTVLSRCLQFNLKQMPQGAIVDHLAAVLKSEGVESEPAALRLVARAANGSMRDALSLLDQAIAHGAGKVSEIEVQAMLGTVGDEYVFGIVDALLEGDPERLYRIAHEMEERSLSFDDALATFGDLMVRIQVAQMAPGAIDPADPDAVRLKALSEAIHPEFVQLAYEIAIQGRGQLPYAPDHGAGFLMTLLRLFAFFPNSERETRSVPAEKKSPLSPEISSRAGQSSPRTGTVGRTSSELQDLPQKAPSPLQGVVNQTSTMRTAAVSVSDWDGLLRQLHLSGMVRELAQNCELLAQSPGRIALRLSAAHRHLLTKASQDRLQQALAAVLGSETRLSIDTVERVGETPAAAVSRARQAERNSAVAAIEGDPAVREMIELLDASINESSIVRAGDSAAAPQI